MVGVSTASATPKNSSGETCVRKVLAEWHSSHIADACIAATQIGLIHSGGVLGYERAKTILREEFDSRKVGDVNWSTFNEAFQNGRCAVISSAEVKARFYPPAANDNKPKPVSGFKALSPEWMEFLKANPTLVDPAKSRFQVTWFDDVDQSAAKIEIVEGVLGAGEFSLWVAKPGTGKS